MTGEEIDYGEEINLDYERPHFLIGYTDEGKLGIKYLGKDEVPAREILKQLAYVVVAAGQNWYSWLEDMEQKQRKVQEAMEAKFDAMDAEARAAAKQSPKDRPSMKGNEDEEGVED